MPEFKDEIVGNNAVRGAIVTTVMGTIDPALNQNGFNSDANKNAIEIIISNCLIYIPQNIDKEGVKNKSLRILSFFSKHKIDGKETSVAQFLEDVIEIANVTEMNNMSYSEKQFFLNAIHTVSHNFIPKIVTDYILNIDQQRLEYLIMDKNGSKQTLSLLHDINTSSWWSKIFTVPYKTTKLLINLFLLREFNKNITVSTVVAITAFILINTIPGLNIGLIAAISIAVFSGIFASLMQSQAGSFIERNKDTLTNLSLFVYAGAIVVALVTAPAITPTLVTAVIIAITALITIGIINYDSNETLNVNHKDIGIGSERLLGNQNKKLNADADADPDLNSTLSEEKVMSHTND